MINHELERLNIASIIQAFSTYTKDITDWFHENIGYIEKINDITDIDPDSDIELDDIFLRDIEVTIKVVKKDYLTNTNQLLENIEIKKLALSHHTKSGLLNFAFIEPKVEVISMKKNLIKITGKLPKLWKKLESHFKDYDLYKCDINKYFRVVTLNHIAQGIMSGSIVNQTALEILLGKKQMSQITIDHSVESKYIGELDKSKQLIFKAAASENDILIVKGPPGTGKTRVITQLIKHFIYEKKDKVILASRTHAALNNVINNLSHTPTSDQYSGIILEKSSYGDNNKEFSDRDSLLARNIRERLKKFAPKNGQLEDLLKKEFGHVAKPNRYLSITKGFSHPSLFVGTITSAKLEKRLESGYKFDESVLIMDEVSKSTIVDVLRYALYAKKIILVGDDMQLGPMPLNKNEYIDFYNCLDDKQKNTFNQLFFDSIFDRLYSKEQNHLMFRTTYRSPEYILKLYNNVAYDNLIESKVTNMKEITFRNNKKQQNLVKLYSKANLILINHNGTHINDQTLSTRSKINEKELEILIEHLNFISKNTKQATEIDVMVMFIYKDQYKMFLRSANSKIRYWKKRFKSFLFGTVDQLQGLEADIVFINTTYAPKNRGLPNNAKYKIQLQDIRRLNVALSRSRQKIIMILNERAYKNAPIFLGDKKMNQTFSDTLNKFDAKGNI